MSQIAPPLARPEALGTARGASRRAALCGMAGLAGWVVLPAAATTGAAPAVAAAPALPAVLSQPALMTPKALGTAQLAVARAGQRLVAVGERGTVLLSDDHGQSWRQAKVPVQSTLTCVSFASARVGWAAGHAGVILRSDDGGESWLRQMDGLAAARLAVAAAQAQGDVRQLAQAQQALGEGADKPFFDLEFIDERRGFAAGAYNLLLATEDGGTTWTSWSHRLPNPRSLHLYGLRVAGDHLVIAGEQGLLLRAARLGAASFEAVASPYKGSFFGLVQAAPGVLVAFGLRGSAYRSTDGGAQWARVETDTPVTLSAGAALADGRFVLASQAGALLLGQARTGTGARTAGHHPVPITGAVVAGDGALVLSTLRGMHRLPGWPQA